jgi:hypothetical protein
LQVRRNYREPGITEREPKSPTIASPGADDCKPQHVGRGGRTLFETERTLGETDAQSSGFGARLLKLSMSAGRRRAQLALLDLLASLPFGSSG